MGEVKKTMDIGVEREREGAVKPWFARAGVGLETEMLKNLWGPQLSGAKPLEKHWFSKENWWMTGGGGREPGGTATPN